MEEKRLTRSDTDKVVAGVCSGLAKYLNIDTAIVRLIFILGFIFGFSSAFWIYIILWFLIPKESDLNSTTGSADTMQKNVNEMKERVEDVIKSVKGESKSK